MLFASVGIQFFTLFVSLHSLAAIVLLPLVCARECLCAAYLEKMLHERM